MSSKIYFVNFKAYVGYSGEIVAKNDEELFDILSDIDSYDANRNFQIDNFDIDYSTISIEEE